jgi:hypothetical protein
VKRHGLTRREMLGRSGITVIGAGGLTLAGLGGYAWPHEKAAAATRPAAPVTPAAGSGVLHFVTRPDLTPPALTIAHHGTGAPAAADPPYIILSPSGYPRSGPGTPGLMILDRHGGIVWYSPNTGFPASKGQGRIDLKVQTYRGKPVLTWWQGQVITGRGEGRAVIADTGSMQVLATGHVLVGWGNLPYFSEFAADGTLIMDGQFPVGDQSYRAFTANWTGQPTDQPAVAARVNPAGGSVVYASWNGATDVATWTVLAGKTASALVQAGSQRRAGFETMITVNSLGPYFAVAAEDASGRVLARSATVRLEK